MTGKTTVPFFALRDFPAGIEQELKNSLLQAVDEKQYILGKQVQAFEAGFATDLGAAFAVGVGSGLDALVISLKAAGVRTGDEVILPANTFIATANAIVQAGATPVFAEPNAHTYNLKAETIAGKITARTKAVIPVHLYGQPCEMKPIMDLANSAGVKVIEDAAQAHGAGYKGKKAGTFGFAGAFSFYPTKNLGAMGDGGAIVTNDAEAADFARKYRNYGELQKYQNELIGVNSRLDTLQAAVLTVKLRHLQEFNKERQRLAAVYIAELSHIADLVLPITAAGCEHVYHVFNIRTRQRDALQQYLLAKGIQTLIHYPVPVHLQPAYSYLGYRAGDFPVAEELTATSLSLPLFPGLTEHEQEAVINGIKTFFSQHYSKVRN